MFPPLLLQAAPPPKYALAPWYLRWLESMPVYVVVCLAIVALVLYLVRNALSDGMTRLFDLLVERMKRSSKEPASPTDLARKANKAIVLEQAAERLRLAIDCDHVSVYGCQNGEYLRSGEGIDKFVMQAEAVDDGLPRYMDTERTVFAQDIPRTVLALERQPYLLLWSEHCDDWKVNKLMRERGYDASIAVFVRRPIRTAKGETELGVIGMYVLSWRDTLLYTHHQEAALPRGRLTPTRLLDEPMEALLSEYASTFSYTM